MDEGHPEYGRAVTVCWKEISRSHTQIFAVLLCGWLGGLPTDGRQARLGRLFTLEEVGQILAVPVNLKDRDAFHITIEEYLQSLITLIDELVGPRLAQIRGLVMKLLIGTSSRELRHTWGLRTPSTDKSIYQGCPRWVPNSQSEE